jgi:hypothetical protein
MVPPLAVGKPLPPMKKIVDEVSPFGRSPFVTLTYEAGEVAATGNCVPQATLFSRGLAPAGNAAYTFQYRLTAVGGVVPSHNGISLSTLPGQTATVGSAGHVVGAGVVNVVPVSCTQSTPPTFGPADATEAVRPNATRNHNSCFIWSRPPRKIRSPTTGMRRSTRKPFLPAGLITESGTTLSNPPRIPQFGKIGKTRVPHLPCRSPLPTTEGYREITPARQADCGRKIGDRGRTRVCPAWPPSPGSSKTRRDPAPGEVLTRERRGARALERVPAPIHKERGRRTP